MGARKWWRDHFTDHPLYKEKDPIAFQNPARKDKVKCICTECLHHYISEALQTDEMEVTRGAKSTVRTVQEIEMTMFSDDQHKWISSRSATLLTHLRGCSRQPEPVRTRALSEINKNKAYHEHEEHMTPRAQRTIHYNTRSLEASQGADWGSWMHSPFETPHQGVGTSHAPGSRTIPFPELRPMEHLNMSNSNVFEDAPHYTGKRSRIGSYASSTRSLSTRNSYSDLAGSPGMTIEPLWTEFRQALFEDKLIKLTASADLSLSWVENPEWLAFVDEFIPQAKSPSCKVLSQRILPSTLKELRADSMRRAEGLQVTVQCDGWTGENHHHLVAFMMTGKQQLFTVKLNDTTIERKTAINMLAQMIEVINMLKNDWKVDVIAFTSDASGESRKARKLLVNRYPSIVAPDCYAHQINLIVGDYFKAKSDFLAHASRANDVIAWLRSKTAILGLIRSTLVAAGKKEKSIIRPVPTRWTAFYLAYSRLLELREVLQVIITSDAIKRPEDRILIQGDAKSKSRAADMVVILQDPVFWFEIQRIQHHLEPLAIAANVTQATFCRLDDVLLTFASLFVAFTKLSHPSDATVKNALLSSLDKRWKNSDQEVFIAATILNPFIQLKAFIPSRLFRGATIYSLMKHLWARFYNEEAPPSLYTELTAYLANEDDFEDLPDLCSVQKIHAEQKERSPDPLRIYMDLSIPGAPQSPLTRLAFHLLSICPNSASCERLFSSFGMILTKRRSRLTTSKLLDLAELKMHIRDGHLRKESKKDLRKRAFAVRKDPVSLQPLISEDPGSQPPGIEADIPNPQDFESSVSPSLMSDSTTDALNAITARLTEMVSTDDDNDQIPATPSNSPLDVKLCELFRPDYAPWMIFQQRTAVGSLDEERELYELLDLDAPGEEILDIDVDQCAEYILDN